MNSRTYRCPVIWLISALLFVVSTSIAESRQRVYVAESLSALVSVIDVETNSFVTSIPVGNIPTAVGVSPEGGLLYVANRGEGPVSVINTKPKKPIGLVNGLDLPLNLVVT